MKPSKYIIQIFAIFCIELMILMPINFVHALSISNVQALDVGATSASINWETDEVATGKVRYGSTPELGFTRRHSTYIFDHELTIQGLDSETTYFYEVESTNINGDTLITNNNGQYYTFTTADITPPSQVKNLSLVEVDFEEIRFTWEKVNVSDFSHYKVYRQNVFLANTTDDFYQDSGLSPGNTYNYKVSAVDTSGNEGAQSISFFATTNSPDIEAPLISNLQVADITADTATITWLTDENANGKIHYGPNGVISLEETDNAYDLDHSVLLPDLFSGVDYTVIAESCDESDNCINSSPIVFEAGIDTTPPFINITMPRYVNRNFIDISGNVETRSRVDLYVNNLNSPVKSVIEQQTKNGEFEFRVVQLAKENIVRIVATDEEGNVNEANYRVTVDTKEPEIIMDDIRTTYNDENLSLVGTVDEPVTINVFLRFGSNIRPHKITDVFAFEDDDSIGIEWNESVNRDDFSHYIIYRNDVGPIGITDAVSRNSFKDTTTNQGQEYIYYVTQVDKFGKESEISEIVRFTLDNGPTDIVKPKPIDKKIVENPTRVIETNRSFSESLLLNKDDGVYTLVIEILDRAKNRILIEKTITLDTNPPDLEITNPPKGTLLYENYAGEVDIRGTTEPGARVYLYVDRTPIGKINSSGLISSRQLVEDLEEISEDAFEEECSVAAFSFSACDAAADYSVTADSDGFFEIPDVDLTDTLSFESQVEYANIVDLNNRNNLEKDQDVRLIFIVVDDADLRTALEHKVRLGNCWSTNQDWSITPLTQYQTPSFISPQRLAENKETINFYFKYDYAGLGEKDKAKITNVAIRRACDGTEILGQKRFNVSCMIMPSSGTSIVNDKGDHSFTTIRLQRLNGMDEYVQLDWEGFFKAISNELTFPMKVTLTYQYEEGGKKKTGVQTTCQEVTYVMDNSLIDPRDILPDWLLYDFVEFLQESSTSLTELNKQLRSVMEYVVIGCVSSWGLRAAFQVMRRFSEFWAEKTFALKETQALFNIISSKSDDPREQYCKQVTLNVMQAYNLGSSDYYKEDATPFNDYTSGTMSSDQKKIFRKALGKVKLKYFSDNDLKICFPSVYSAWQQEAEFYQFYRYTCDRVFGHKTPSAWTETKNNNVLTEKQKGGQVCEKDESVRGRPLRAEECSKLVKSGGFRISESEYGRDDKCVIITKSGTTRTKDLYKISKDPHNGNIYQAVLANKDSASVKEIFIIRGSHDKQYFHYEPRTCAQVCGAKTEFDVEGERNNKNTNAKKYVSIEKQYSCMPTNVCRTLPNDERYMRLNGNNKQSIISKAEPAGFTEDCYYKAEPNSKQNPQLIEKLKKPEVVSNDADLRYECCCIGAKQVDLDIYYKYDDKNRYKTPANIQLDDGLAGNDCAFQSRTSQGKCAGDEIAPRSSGGDTDAWKDMKWSYRYWKIKYQTRSKTDENKYHQEFNPNRYIEHRDYPACFGQNSLYHESTGTIDDGEPGKLLIIDPRQQHTSMLQCANIGGISNRIQMLVNIMNGLSSCLIDVRETGTSDSAACKEFFTMYVCDAMWSVVSQFANQCSAFSLSESVAEEDDFFATIRGGVGSIYETMNDNANELNEEYGNAALNSLVGQGGSGIARKVCLAAFGYDFDLSLDGVVDAAYAQNFASLVTATTKTREYLTVEPNNANARYEYKSAWVINPGCDIDNYRVQLACVTRNEVAGNPDIRCDQVNSPDGSNCDCLDSNLGSEALASFYSSPKRVKQNEFIQEGESKIVASKYRYDHLKFTVTPSSKIPAADRGSCFPANHEDGIFYFPLKDKTAQNVAGCVIDPLSGVFDCSSGLNFFNEKGLANIVELKINGREPTSNKVEVASGEPIEYSALVRKSIGAQDKCLQLILDKRDGTAPRSLEAIPIEVDGSAWYGPYNLDTAALSSRNIQTINSRVLDSNPRDSSITRSLSLSLSKITAANSRTESIDFNFKDEGPAGIVLSENSPDLMTVKGSGISTQTKTIADWWDNQENGPVVSINNGQIKLKITNVGFDNRLESIEYRIDISGSGVSSRTWAIRSKLYEMNEGATNCGSLQTEREVIKYQGQAQDVTTSIVIKNQVGQQNGRPSINLKRSSNSEPTILPDSLGHVTIDVDIEDSDGISQVIYELRHAFSGSGKDLVGNNLVPSECTKTGNTKISCQLPIKTNALPAGENAGKYILEVKAYDQSSSRLDTIKTIEIDVDCGDITKQGFCGQQGASCSPISNPGLGCIDTNKVCCAK